MPFIGMENIESHSRRVLRFERAGDYKSDGFRFFPGDILYGRLRPYLNKVWCADREGICSGEFIVLPPSKSIDSSLLAYALSQHDFVCFASDLNRGDRPRVTFEQIGEYELEIPETVEEQKRLAARLNRITAHLGEVKARLATIPPLLKRSRQSILAAACSGR
ncbi:MAG TPA: restriction endonuclease subunit S, partial [Candidatus Ozemobacteraceae bacterium]|nr:restriction endonuclease subunit S [Candidatus Ozemobacteraceae bacterium]